MTSTPSERVALVDTLDNARRVWHALASFGARLDCLTHADLIDEDAVIQNPMMMLMEAVPDRPPESVTVTVHDP